MTLCSSSVMRDDSSAAPPAPSLAQAPENAAELQLTAASARRASWRQRDRARRQTHRDGSKQACLFWPLLAVALIVG